LTLVPPTATATSTATATTEPTATSTAEQPTPTAAATAAGDGTPTETATPYPTATPYTLEGFTQNYQNYIAQLESEAKISEAQFREIFRRRVLYDKVFAEVTKDVDTTEDYIWARHILVASREEAAVILGKLEAGQDWSELAAQFSLDESNKNNGGDLGWFTASDMVEEFSNIAFSLKEIGEISQPVETTYGWHVIQLLGKERRPASSDRADQIKQQKFTEWLNSVKAEMTIETFDNWVGNVPTTPETPPALLTQ